MLSFSYIFPRVASPICILLGYSLGGPVITTESSPPLSSVLHGLADSCSSPPISSFIKSKLKECSESPSFANKQQFGCLLLLDISSQLCNAVAANQVDIQSADLDKIKEFVDVATLCAVAKTWNAAILSQDPKYNKTIDEMFKKELVCARVCGVEEITSQDSNIFCKFYKWGTEMLAAGITQLVTAQDRINETSGLPSGEEQADPATSGNSGGEESHLRNEVAQLNKPVNLPGAPRNPAVEKPAASGNEVTNHAGLGGNPGSVPLGSSPLKGSENHSGAARNPAGPNPPGSLGNEASSHVGVGTNSGSPLLDSNPPKGSENHSGAARNPGGQNLPGSSGNAISNHAANSGTPLLDSSPLKGSENHSGAARNPGGQNLPGSLGNEGSNHAGIGANAGSPLLDSIPPKGSENHSGPARNPGRQNLPGSLGNEGSNHAGIGANSGSPLLDLNPPKGSENHSGAARNPGRQNLPGSLGNEGSSHLGVGGNSGSALLDTFDYEDQPLEDSVDGNSAQSLGDNGKDPVNGEQTSGRSSSSVSKNRLGIDDDVDEDHFFSFFLTVIIMVVLLYILYHNKNKVSKVFFGLLVEGRQGRRRNSRGHAYRRLDTLEQAMSTNSAAPPSKIIY